MANAPAPPDLNFTRVARLTAAFYAWEGRGRGWAVWPYPVVLEPPFRPFALDDTSQAIADDARKPTLFSRWAERLRGSASLPPAEPQAEETESAPARARGFSVYEIQIALPPDVKVTADIAEHFLLSLSSCREPVSFEIVGTGESIAIQFAASERDAPQVRDQLRAYFPDAVISETREYLADACRVAGPHTVIADFGLSHEFMRPLKTFARFDADPLIGILGALSDLEANEVAVLQVLFQSTRSPWGANILRSVTDWDGADFFADAPELLPLAKQKTARPLFASVLRLAVRSPSPARAWQLARRIGGTFAQLAEPTSNEFIPLENVDYPDDIHFEDIIARQTRRTGAILNSEELVSLVHPPSTVVRAPRLKRDERRTKVAPRELTHAGFVIGENIHGGASRPIALAEEQRLRHTHVVGASGTGKSTLLMSLIAQDIEQGSGLAILDPHGDLIDEVLCRIPESRAQDVVLIDPADSEYPVGFNILSAHSELEKTLLASDLVAIFRRLSTSWGDQMTSVLSNAVLAFLESTKGGTIADLRRFLVEAEYRKEFLTTVQDPEVVYYWQKEFPLLTGRPQAPLLTRLDAFLRPQLVRRMVTQPTALDFGAIMNEGRILLVKLAQGAIGEENAALLGSFFVAKLNQLVMGRQAIRESERRPFYLYIDEFQHFVTPSMATLMTGARKYRLGLVLAHQELRQLLNQDRDVAGAVLANAATRISFRVGDDDAKKLEDGFASFSARDLQNLGRGQAVCRVDRADWDFSLTTTPLPALNATAREHGQAIAQLSRAKYGTRFIASRPEQLPKPERPRETTLAASLGHEAGRPAPREVDPPATRSQRSDLHRPSEPELPSPTAGRGGAQHKYLQELIRRWAEANGWRATVEKQVLDGLGSIDVLLEREQHSIGCEIAVSSTTEYEIGNIRKCLTAGCSEVISIAPEARTRQRLSAAIAQQLESTEAQRVRILAPENLFEHLASTQVKGEEERTTRGYKVKLKVASSTLADAPAKAIARTVVGALKRMRKS